MNRQKAVILVSVFALLVGLLSVFAVASSVDDFLLVPYSDTNSNGVLIGVRTNGLSAYLRGSSDTSPIYCALCGNDLACFSLEASGYVCYTVNLDGSVSQNGGATTYYDTFVIDGVTYHYTPNMPYAPIATFDSAVPVYSDLATAQAAFADFIQNPPSPVPSVSDFSFDLSAGNIAVIETSSTPTDVYLSATMPDLSKPWIAGPEPDYWPDDLVTYGYVSSAPVAGSSLSSLTGYISWDRGSDRNLLGQTQSAVKNFTFDLDNNAQYLVVYNYPYYPFSGNNSSSAPTIHFVVEDAVSVVVYSGTVTASGTTLGEIVYNRTPEGSWEDSEGGNSAPPPGGGNYIPSDGDIFSVLTDLVSDIDSFFTGTWQYIRNIVDSLSGFPAFVVQLYSWLPQEFRVVIFSAFNIVVMIGVLKVML